MNVKKILSIVAIALFISAVFTSCRSRDACPGVSKVTPVSQAVIG
tara:strand:- start:20336 stop:20470 length:135 start_codon:yes stop_codon:yes gene_type:complete